MTFTLVTAHRLRKPGPAGVQASGAQPRILSAANIFASSVGDLVLAAEIIVLGEHEAKSRHAAACGYPGGE